MPLVEIYLDCTSLYFSVPLEAIYSVLVLMVVNVTRVEVGLLGWVGGDHLVHAFSDPHRQLCFSMIPKNDLPLLLHVLDTQFSYPAQSVFEFERCLSLYPLLERQGQSYPDQIRPMLRHQYPAVDPDYRPGRQTGPKVQNDHLADSSRRFFSTLCPLSLCFRRPISLSPLILCLHILHLLRLYTKKSSVMADCMPVRRVVEGKTGSQSLKRKEGTVGFVNRFEPAPKKTSVAVFVVSRFLS